MLPQAVEMRVIRLEENSYFLEEQLKKLDQQMVEQQAQIDLLQKGLHDVSERLREVREALSDAPGRPGNAGCADETPPHHVPRLW